MLFNTPLFIFGFLPVALALTWAAGRWSQVAAKVAICLVSVAFYGLGDRRALPLLIVAILANFAMGRLIQASRDAGATRRANAWLALGIAADLGLLIAFKYADVFASGLAALRGRSGALAHIALPLAISFFTFQLIAYLVDVSRGEAKRTSFLDFALFVSFFPKLISGPIVHEREFMPQVRTRRFGRLNGPDLLVGLVIFAIGLFKKAVIADTLASYAGPLFPDRPALGSIGLISGWLAAAVFTLQIYFDFSGYSDMAIGVARMLGVKLPLNFHSPLRAASIVEFWRRWHMTLQRFIVAYVFQPLSLPLNRLAARWGLGRMAAFGVGVCAPVAAAFLASGLWHGAGWTFVVWGLMHAVYVCIEEAWRERRKALRRKLKKAGRTLAEPGWAQVAASHALTLGAVAAANVVFRAADTPAAVSIWAGMCGFGGLGAVTPDLGLAATLMAATALVVLAPNTQQIMARFSPAENWSEWRVAALAPMPWTWRPSLAGLGFAGAVLFLGLAFIQRGPVSFLYFKF